MKSWSKFGLKINIFLEVVGSSLNEVIIGLRWDNWNTVSSKNWYQTTKRQIQRTYNYFIMPSKYNQNLWTVYLLWSQLLDCFGFWSLSFRSFVFGTSPQRLESTSRDRIKITTKSTILIWILSYFQIHFNPQI